MRKLYCYMILPLMALVSGCQHEEFMPAEQDGDLMEVYATIEDIDDGQTRTYLSGTDVYWSSGDKIAVFLGNTLRKRFDVTPESIDSKDATFQYDSQYIITGNNSDISHNISYSKETNQHTYNKANYKFRHTPLLLFTSFFKLYHIKALFSSILSPLKKLSKNA